MIKQDMEKSVSQRHESADDKAVSHGTGRKFPQVGQGIQIDQRDGVFVVLRTDSDRGTVDVLQMSGIRQIEGGVPLGTVRVLQGRDPMVELQGEGG